LLIVLTSDRWESSLAVDRNNSIARLGQPYAVLFRVANATISCDSQRVETERLAYDEGMQRQDHHQKLRDALLHKFVN
jgi:hypothetical protein